MLRKLLRYEFKALLQILPVFYLAFLIPALTAGIGSRIPGSWMWSEDLSSLFLNILGLMLPVVLTVNLVTVIRRFRENLLKDEGYLMFTLPVPEWKLVASKGIAAFCTILLTGIMWSLSALIFGFIRNSDEIMEQLPFILEMPSIIGVPRMITITAIALVFILQQMFLVYASMTISQLAPRFRRLAAFGVYLAVIIVEYHITRAVHSLFFSNYFPAILVLETALAALYLWCTSRLLKHTLNLE
jgi:hypothetical protein